MAGLLRNSCGVALILTILIVGLIIALTVEFNRAMRDHVASAGNIGHGLKALYTAKSGVSYGLAMLKDDPADVDSVRDDWADPDKLRIASAGSQTLFVGGQFELKIEDLSGKIQINHLVKAGGSYDDNQKAVLVRFLKLEEFGLDPGEVDDIVAAIKDWLDADDDDTRSPAEDGYYLFLERPYVCKDGPLDSVEELLLVKGMTPELFYGTEDQPGVAAYVSVFGDGKININTADPMVLESLHEDITSKMAEEMRDYRREVRDPDKELMSLSPPWYQNAGVPDTITINDEIIQTNSKYFQITSHGSFGDMSRQVVAVVERVGGNFRTLYWKIE